LKGLFADVGGEDDVVLQAIEALAAEDLLGDGVVFLGSENHILLD
jgi:hypothetical protein